MSMDFVTPISFCYLRDNDALCFGTSPYNAPTMYHVAVDSESYAVSYNVSVFSLFVLILVNYRH